jgi:preprotein translocase subunit SecA
MLRERLHALWRRISDSPVSGDLTPYRRRVAEVAALEPSLKAQSQAELEETARQCLHRLRAAGDGDGDAGSVAPPLLFALVREAARRQLGVRLFDEQVIAGLALAEGDVVELQTGEGKTLAAVAPTVARATAGRGAHVWTFNDYLAARDAEWMGPLYRLFGLRAAAVLHDTPPELRRDAYRADVTYSTARETGFDFLRDQLVSRRDERVQRPLHALLVDEADSLLIDEARIPLVLAGGAASLDLDFERLIPLVRALDPGVDFDRDETQRNVFLTDAGIAKLEAQLECPSLHAEGGHALLTAINLSLHAAFLLLRDRDYIVRHGRIELVDDRTGRVVSQRRWPAGLQQALEVKEGLPRQTEGRVLASITLQHLCPLYPHRSGMTGTAQSCAEELRASYGMSTLVLPPHRPCRRVDAADRVFATRADMESALLAEIRRAHERGQPVLVGTATVAESEHLAALLERDGLRFALLNAKNDTREAALIADAGLPGAVTIATNMAGRGTDIRLGGPDGRHAEQVAAAGGLYVIGTNRHESRRVDDQLRGRAGRQGDAGQSCFFVSLEDPLFQRFGLSARLPKLSSAVLLTDEETSREIERTQRIAEGQNHDIRLTLLKYTELVEQQRRTHQALRDRLLAPGSAIAWLEQLEEREGPLVTHLRARSDAPTIDATVRRIVLSRLDDGWADHLDEVAEIRESIYLHSVGGSGALSFKLGPIEAFRMAVARAFAGLVDRAEAAAVEDLRLAVERGEDLEKAGVPRPSATWTYLVSDDPFADPMQNAWANIRERWS